MVKDGVLRNVSFMYRVFQYAENEDDSVDDVFIATDWEPFEISIVTVPADPNVGVGRALSDEKGADLSAVDGKAVVYLNESPTMENIENARMDAVQQERSRINEISALCAEHAIDDNKRNQMIADGISVADARSAVLDVLKARGAVKPVADVKPDFAEKDLKGYSLIRAIHAQVTGDWSKAGMERELSKECARKLGRESAGGFFMPTAIRASDYTVGTAAKGGNLVATDLLAGDFIDMLRNNAIVMQLGAKVLSGLVGNVAIPRQSGAASTYWVAEDGDVTASSGSFDQVSLTPKTIGALSSMSRRVMQQSTPDIEMLVRNDLAKQIALGIDLAALNGSGASGQPKGICNTTGIGSVTISDAITYYDLIDLETAVASANADVGGMAYVANAAMIGTLKKLKDGDDRPIWYQNEGVVSGTPGQINGYNVYRTNQCPSGKVIFGNFSDLIIGEWGSLEILPNAYGDGYKNGAIEIRALQTVDIALRHAESFAVAA